MSKIIKIIINIMLCLCLLTMPTHAHSGRTDSSGGHYNHSTGKYHYHHGYPAHSHYDIDGDGTIDCPYKSQGTTTNKAKQKITTNDIINSIVAIILVSAITLVFGIYFEWFCIIQIIIMLPIKALIEKYCNKESKQHILNQCETIVLYAIAIASVIIIALSILSSKGIL